MPWLKQPLPSCLVAATLIALCALPVALLELGQRGALLHTTWLAQAIGVLLLAGVIFAIGCVRRERLARKRVALQYETATHIIERSLNVIFVIDTEHTIVNVNRAFTRLTGRTREQTLGQHFSSWLTPQSAVEIERIRALHATAQSEWQAEIQGYRADGELIDGLLCVSYIVDAEVSEPRWIGILTDTSHLKRHERELQRIAHYDALTGLPNRVRMAQLVDAAIAAHSASQQHFALCYLNLDAMQTVNDSYGQDIGDQVLIAIAERLRAALRGNDVVAHVGGDEFVLLHANMECADICYAQLDSLLKTIQAPLAIAGFSLRISTSIGVTFYPHDNANADTLMRHANHAMHEAKENGKQHVHVFDVAREHSEKNRRKLLQRLTEALAHDEFRLYFQPKVDLFDNRVIGAEALIRWLHPERGLVAPAEFLPALEGSDLEIAVGEWVIETALRQIERWLHLAAICIPVSVNISAKHLLQPDFATRLQRALKRHPEVPEHCLEIEIIESVALNDIEAAIHTLNACKQLGVRFALDDFGTGYSSLSYFQRLPVDILKIDQSFVRNMHENIADLEIIESVVQLAQVFNRVVIAEGIETEQHAAMLRHIGCRLGQGYGIAKPMPADQLEHWIRQWEQRARDASITPVQSTPLTAI